jgi:hypothetical protein
MKRIIYQLYALLFFTFLVSGCTDIMDKRDLTNISADDVWVTPSYVSGYVNYVMEKDLPKEEHNSFHNTDESYSLYDLNIVNDLFNTDDDNDKFDKWNYEGIRRVNKFLDNIDKIPTDRIPRSTLEQYIGQMKVLRAWLYFEMVRIYGGVPLILHEQRTDENLSIPRSKTSECIAAIVQDLDDAIALENFPMRWTGNNAGRISKAAAYALKGRVLLTYASPQFSNTIGAGTKSADQRWTEAYNACKEAKEKLTEAGHKLYRPDPLSGDVESIITNYFDMLVNDEMNDEIVWARRYIARIENGERANSWDGSVRPQCTNSQGQRPGITLEVVSDFPKADGTPYTDFVIPNTSNGNNVEIEKSTVAFWKNRDPRFYAFIAYNGCIWPLNRLQQTLSPDDVKDGIMQHQWIFEQADFPYENAYDQYGGGAGFRIRKMVSATNYATGDNQGLGAGDYPLIRYAEVLFNFAETAAKTGHENDAIQVLRDIRKRAAIPAGNDGNYGLQSSQLSGNALLATILNERRIELLFEGFRYHDVRRWRLYTDDLVPGATTIREGRKLNGLYRHTIKPVMKRMNPQFPDHSFLATLDVNNEDDYFGEFEHSVRAHDVSPINFTERLYFLRIPYIKHIRVNPVIEQTQGWTDVRGPGTFDPYE